VESILSVSKIPAFRRRMSIGVPDSEVIRAEMDESDSMSRGRIRRNPLSARLASLAFRTADGIRKGFYTCNDSISTS
jgi:hypothetical protein